MSETLINTSSWLIMKIEEESDVLGKKKKNVSTNMTFRILLILPMLGQARLPIKLPSIYMSNKITTEHLYVYVYELLE